MTPGVHNPLLVCVECGHPISSVYREYSRGNIRLSRCVSELLLLLFCARNMCDRPVMQRKCRSIGDKYVEFESVLLLLDVFLHRVGVYRHLLFNRLPLSLGVATATLPPTPGHTPSGSGSSAVSDAPKPFTPSPQSRGRGLPPVWKISLVFLALQVYTRLYLVTLEQLSPSHNLWETPIPSFRDATDATLVCNDANCQPFPFQVDLLTQHTSLSEGLAAARKVFLEGSPTVKFVDLHSSFPLTYSVNGSIWIENLRCAATSCVLRVRREGTSSAIPGGATFGMVPENATFDIGDAVWQLPGLPTLFWQSVFASLVEMIVYSSGILIAVRLAGTMARSRARIDPITGLPRILPPKSSRRAPPPVLQSRTSESEVATSLSDVFSAPPPGVGTGSVRMKRSISTGNTEAANEIRNEMLQAERERQETTGERRGEERRGEDRRAGDKPIIEMKTPPPKPCTNDTYGWSATLACYPLIRALQLSPLFSPPRDVIDDTPPTREEYGKIVHSLLVGSFIKVFVTLSMVWNYPVTYIYALSFFTLSSHATAIQAVCDCSVTDSVLVVACGMFSVFFSRILMQQLGLVDQLLIFL